MKKRFVAMLTAAAMLMTTACGDDPAPEATPTPAPTQEAQPEPDDGEVEEDGDESDAQRANHSLSMSVNGEDGQLVINRATRKGESMGDPDTWTIFVYLCGTDLESEEGYGAATGDVAQMLNADESDNVRFVLQTGGTSMWANEYFSADACERWVVQNQDMEMVDSVPLSNMGDPETLAEFLKWGVAEYPADKMGVIFWDHGGGSITGACFDELNDGDSLSLPEMNEAFSQVYADMTDQFEFIGYDCCLMGTAETANILATYARYFYGSQETEPGTGWDYTAIGSFLAEDPSVDGADLGKVITDSFYAECEAGEQESGCTFTIVNLEKFDTFAEEFNSYAKELYEAAGEDLAGIVRGVSEADNFGGNNQSEGYTNMVDLGGIVEKCSDYADGSALINALNDCIVYNKNGMDHRGASGLSVYYPLQLQGSNEIGLFNKVSFSPYYMSLVDMVAKGYTDNGYTNEVFFTEDGEWYSGDCEVEDFDDSYFDDYTEGGGESELITFASEPALDENGVYSFTFDESGLEYAASVCAYIYYDIGSDELVELGETFDVNVDWESGEVQDNFDGYWLALPNEQLLSTYIVGVEDDYVIYTSPIMLNGRRTNLRIRVYNDYSTVIEGAWDGIDENGVAAREIRSLKAGDKISVIYTLTDDSEVEMDEYVWADGDTAIYTTLPAGDYYYGFGIDDVYGDYFITDFVVFGIDENGDISFYEE